MLRRPWMAVSNSNSRRLHQEKVQQEPKTTKQLTNLIFLFTSQVHYVNQCAQAAKHSYQACDKSKPNQA